MLLIDFEQAFVVHNAYRDSERDLLRLSLRILAFPPVIAGALLSAKLISSPEQVSVVLRLPLIWLALVAAGVLNSVVVRAYVVNDRVQTEAKHQVNRLRSLYLTALADKFPPGWQPVWGSTNPYLETRVKFKAAASTPILLGTANTVYVGYGLDRLLAYEAHVFWHLAATIPTAVLYLFIQLELAWNIFRSLRGRADRERKP